MKKCPKCGMQLQDEMMFCTSCGEDVRQVMPTRGDQSRFCLNCGNHVYADMKSCGRCGCNLEIIKTGQIITEPKMTNRTKSGLSPKKKVLLAVFGTIITIAILIVIIIPKDKYYETNKVYNTPDIDNTESDINNTESNTIPLDYNFDEIVVNEGTKFISIERGMLFMSKDANYYGEITAGDSSYVVGTFDHDIEGTYSLFVTKSGSMSITIKCSMNAYYRTDTLTGKSVGNNVEYPNDHDWFFGKMTMCTDGFEVDESISGLSIVRCALGDNEILASETWLLKACVISEDEAIRYVQDGTLPDCLQNLTVSGLDLIFKKP